MRTLESVVRKLIKFSRVAFVLLLPYVAYMADFPEII